MEIDRNGFFMCVYLVVWMVCLIFEGCVIVHRRMGGGEGSRHHHTEERCVVTGCSKKIVFSAKIII